MKDAVTLGEQLLSLLDASARTSTYKPALLLALIDRAQEHLGDDGAIPVRDLAERVIELYWPQTLGYPTTGDVLLQNQAGGQAKIVQDVGAFRAAAGTNVRALPERLRSGADWERLVDRVELTLAEWPVPRLQRPFAPFLYAFDWPWQEDGRWTIGAYRRSSARVRLLPGVAEALVSLGPLLRPFITRWWTDKAAQLNPSVEAARSLIEFEQFLFGRDRVALERIAEGLLDLQRGCFYCGAPLGRRREVDHFVPWSRSGDDGLDNLVVACARCNGEKSATLASSDHLAELLLRNRQHDRDLGAIASERQWPRHPPRTAAVVSSAYLRGGGERPLWGWERAAGRAVLRAYSEEHLEIERLLIASDVS